MILLFKGLKTTSFIPASKHLVISDLVTNAVQPIIGICGISPFLIISISSLVVSTPSFHGFFGLQIPRFQKHFKRKLIENVIIYSEHILTTAYTDFLITAVFESFYDIKLFWAFNLKNALF